ncbi:MAG: hypothetical protein ACOYEW_12525 [Anaerolineae bacterium]|jgi:dihydroorotate dehydrogenase electron transfer subunit
MRQDQCRVVANGSLDSGHYLLEIDCDPLGQPARAGQFLMLRPQPGWSDPLRHPAFFSRGGHIGQLLLPQSEAWAGDLGSLLPEETVDALGPLGQPFELRPGASRLLIVALAEPVAPALAVAHWGVRQDCAVSLILGQPSWRPLTDLVPDTVECTVGPLDSLLGLADELRWADQLFLVSPPDDLERHAGAIERARLRLAEGFAGVLVPTDFACGVGACGGCTRRGTRRQHTVCSDGPILDLRDLL